ncbi:MAG TPA: hypothetical protein DCM62_09285 [Bacteroidales bacterium]|nr:hypothetical protein [Bacteroidales bacterium]
MRNNIILSELDKCLFPEIYPYYNQYFQDDIAYLRNNHDYDETSMLNIAFKLKVVKYSLKVEDTGVRYFLNTFYNKLFDDHFDWFRKYDWYELKSVLMFFMVFSTIRNEKELVALKKNDQLKVLFVKYLPKTKPIKHK